MGAVLETANESSLSELRNQIRIHEERLNKHEEAMVEHKDRLCRNEHLICRNEQLIWKNDTRIIKNKYKLLRIADFANQAKRKEVKKIKNDTRDLILLDLSDID